MEWNERRRKERMMEERWKNKKMEEQKEKD